MLNNWTIGVVVRMSILDTKVDGSNPSINMFSPWARDFIRIASVDSAVKWVPGGDNLVKGVQCYELFGGIALKIHTFSNVLVDNSTFFLTNLDLIGPSSTRSGPTSISNCLCSQQSASWSISQPKIWKTYLWPLSKVLLCMNCANKQTVQQISLWHIITMDLFCIVLTCHIPWSHYFQMCLLRSKKTNFNEMPKYAFLIPKRIVLNKSVIYRHRLPIYYI